MDLGRLLRFGRARTAVMEAAKPTANFSVDVPPEMTEGMTAGGALAPRISRNEALQVPAVLRGRNLICSTLAGLPLKIVGPDRRAVDGYLLGGNIDPDVANIVTLANTLEDMVFEGIAWWRVTRFGWHGYPVEAQWVPESHVSVHGTMGHPATSQVSPDLIEPRTGQVFIDGIPVPDHEVIRFDSPNPPLLRHAARAIRTALKLDTTTAMYADNPVPLGSLEPREGAEPLSNAPGSAGDGTDRSEVDALLDDWETARQKRAWAYLQAVQANVLQWNPKDLQLADQRQHAVLEIARAMGIDPEDLGVSTTSRTYQNGEQRRLDLTDFTLAAYAIALQQRLSMRDITPRGYEAKLKFDGFLRSDTKTRMDTFKVGREVGAYDDQRIADLEDIPVEQVRRAREQAAGRPAAEPAQQPRPANGQPNGAQQSKESDVVTARTVNFDAGNPVRIQFAAADTEDFQVDTQRRTITGLMLPWGKVANNGFAKWRFKPDSLDWSAVNRVKLNRNHDSTDLVGVATRLQSGSRGLIGTFKVGRSSDGDRALQDAEDGILDGFSVEVEFEHPDDWQPDPTDESVRLVNRATLRGAALTGTPAFDDARLTAVHASRQSNQGGTMPEEGTGQAQTVDFDAHMGKLAEQISNSHTQLTEQLTTSIGESISAGVKAALENLPAPQDGPQPVRAARYAVTREAPVYAFNGMGHSLVRDAWYAGREQDSDAIERLRKYRKQNEEMSKLAAQFMASQAFAPQSTSTASEIIPPGYRPDLYVPELMQGRPLVQLCSRGTISNATPFTVPTFTSSTGTSADHVEGTNPSDGSLSFDTETVTPGAVSGRLTLTREIVDSSNPAIDQIALATMRESYNQQTEQKVYTALNGTAASGNTVEYAEATVITDVRGLLADYPFVRFAAPTGAAMNQKVTKTFATATGTDGRPLLPSVGAQNTAGLGNAINQGWFIDGLTFVPAWSITDALSDDVVLIVARPDVWVWESPLLTFRFEEKQGPANIELNIFGYFGTHVLRPAGIFAVRNPAT